MIPRIAMLFVLALGAPPPVIADWNATRPLKRVVAFAPVLLGTYGPPPQATSLLIRDELRSWARSGITLDAE